MQPRVVADLVIQQIDAQLAQDAEHTQLLKAFRAFPSNLPRADQDRLRREALEAFEQQFLPSWRKLRTYMAQTYLPRVRPADSIASMKDGRAAYTILIHRLTTTRLSGADIHRLGEQEVARIRGRCRRSQGTSGSPDRSPISRRSSMPTRRSISAPRRRCSPTRETSR